MVTDLQLYQERHHNLSYLSSSEACRVLADKYELNVDSVRGRISRASTKNSNRASLRKAEALDPHIIPPSIKRQHDVIARSTAIFDDWQSVDEDRIAIFSSDKHAPYTRWDAYELELDIAQDLRPHCMTGFNDMLDNKGYGRHDDDEGIYKRTWRQDFANALKLQKGILQDYKHVMHPSGHIVGVAGNHDNWFFSYNRRNGNQVGELVIADYMESLEEDMLVFTRGISENTVHLSDGLAFVHGLSASANPNTLAKKGFQRYMHNGRTKSFVQGHTHRPYEVEGSSVGYSGVKFVNSGHGRSNNPDWLKHLAVNWGMAIVICKYNPTKWEHELELVHFREIKDTLVARYDGNEWTKPIDKEKPL